MHSKIQQLLSATEMHLQAKQAQVKQLQNHKRKTVLREVLNVNLMYLNLLDRNLQEDGNYCRECNQAAKALDALAGLFEAFKVPAGEDLRVIAGTWYTAGALYQEEAERLATTPLNVQQLQSLF